MQQQLLALVLVLLFSSSLCLILITKSGVFIPSSDGEGASEPHVASALMVAASAVSGCAAVGIVLASICCRRKKKLRGIEAWKSGQSIVRLNATRWIVY